MSTSINIVTEPQVTSVRKLPSNLEYLQDVIELAMNVADNSDRSWEVVYIFLFNEDVFEFVTDERNRLLRQ